MNEHQNHYNSSIDYDDHIHYSEHTFQGSVDLKQGRLSQSHYDSENKIENFQSTQNHWSNDRTVIEYSQTFDTQDPNTPLLEQQPPQQHTNYEENHRLEDSQWNINGQFSDSISNHTISDHDLHSSKWLNSSVLHQNPAQIASNTEAYNNQLIEAAYQRTLNRPEHEISIPQRSGQEPTAEDLAKANNLARQADKAHEEYKNAEKWAEHFEGQI